MCDGRERNVNFLCLFPFRVICFSYFRLQETGRVRREQQKEGRSMQSDEITVREKEDVHA